MYYVGPIPGIEYYGADAVHESERKEFLDWYDTQKTEIFDNRRVFEEYCQADFTVLREACQVFRREFLEIGQVEVFLESVTIAIACNKAFRRRSIKPDTIGLIPTEGFTGNVNYSKKAIMWLIYRERVDNCKIQHGMNGREFRLPELPRLSVDGYCAETKRVYEFNGCYHHGHTCMPYRDTVTLTRWRHSRNVMKAQ
jgi:hypothetical protein